jgi:hypothetical protein
MNAKALTKGFEVVEDGIAWIIGDSRKPIINDKTKVHFYLENLLDTINSGDMESIKNCLEELKGALNAWDYYKTMKLIYAYRAGIQIVDVGNNFEEKSIKPIVNEADLTLVVIDPMPVECSQNSKRLDELLEMKKNGFPIEFVVNRFENTVDTEQLKEFIRVTPVAYIPAVDLKYIYKAVYNYKIPFEIKEVEEAIIKPLYQIAKLIIPDELLKDTFTSKEKADKKPFSFGSLLRRLKK